MFFPPRPNGFKVPWTDDACARIPRPRWMVGSGEERWGQKLNVSLWQEKPHLPGLRAAAVASVEFGSLWRSCSCASAAQAARALQQTQPFTPSRRPQAAEPEGSSAVFVRARPGIQRQGDVGCKSPRGPQTQCHPHGFPFLLLNPPLQTR